MHAVIHIWYNQATIIGLKLNIKTLWSVFELFEYMRDAENLYEGSGAPYKKMVTYSNHASGGILKGGQSAFPKGFVKILAGNLRTSFDGHHKVLKSGPLSCLINGPGNYSEDYEVYFITTLIWWEI